MRWGSLLLISTISTFSAAQSGRVDAPPSDPTSQSTKASSVTAGKLPPIVVTGRMMGYYRLPDRQPLRAPRTFLRSHHARSTRRKTEPGSCKFLKQYLRRDDTLLVGAGDNFSPNYFSRAFEMPTCLPTPTQPADAWREGVLRMGFPQAAMGPLR